MPDNRDIFEHLLQAFDEAEMPYCILSGYDDYPESIASDIDFMVMPGWIDRLPGLIAGVAKRSGGHLVQCLDHETTASYFVIARQEGAHVTYLHPDATADYRRRGKLWLRAHDLLPKRRRHAQGFWVPAPADAFTYYLIKKLDKGSLDDAQGVQLSRRFAEDRAGGAKMLRKLLPPLSAHLVEKAAASGDWAPVRAALPLLRKALRPPYGGEAWRDRLSQNAGEARRVVGRIVRPSGLSIAILGPDGSGKSSLAGRLVGELAPAFRQVSYQHLKPRLRMPPAAAQARTVLDPHAKPLRGRFMSTAKLLHFWTGYVTGGLFGTLPAQIRSTLQIFDRYYHDILVDPRRYRYGGSPELARKLGCHVPQPDIVIILDAPPDILQERKQEVPFAESKRQRMAYLALAREFNCAHVVDAGQPIEQVATAVLKHVLADLEARTLERLPGFGEVIA
jgi:thymidylate kinase